MLAVLGHAVHTSAAVTPIVTSGARGCGGMMLRAAEVGGMVARCDRGLAANAIIRREVRAAATTQCGRGRDSIGRERRGEGRVVVPCRHLPAVR